MKQIQTKQIADLYQKVANWLNKQAFKDRLMIMLSLWAILFLIWYAILLLPMQSSKKMVSNNLANLENQVKVLEQQIKVIGSPTAGSQKSYEAELRELKEQLAITKKNLVIHQGEMLPPGEAVTVLRNLMNQEGGLELLGFERGEPEEISIATAGSKLEKMDFTLTFKGTYFATLNYLKSIENLKWRLFWDSLTYKVLQYPDAEITLKVHTLSRPAGLGGVNE